MLLSTPAADRPQIKLIFLHIGKNAGTQILHLASQLQNNGIIINKVPHRGRLRDINGNDRYFFSIRNPISRFKSGFYSRKRKGQPRIYNEWTPHEAAAFKSFEHANDLAESLFRTDETGRTALQAIQAISHTAMQQIDWFQGCSFLQLRPPVWIIRQEHLATDFDTLLERLGSSIRTRDLTLANDDARAHRNDYTGVPELSVLARDNLMRWYARDFLFYDLCAAWMTANQQISK
jgi:hypothetical protein